jgi:hypothetical protein
MRCATCNGEVPLNVTACPECGAYLPANNQSGGNDYARPIAITLASAMALMIAIVAAFAVAVYAIHVRMCPAIAEAMALAQKSAEAGAALGEPIRAGWFVTGAVRNDRRAGFALLTIPVQGSRGRGKLNVVANRVGERWNLESVALRMNGQRMDLTPAPEREAFKYPAEGRVYMLPLDEEAAVLLGDYPAYFKARLGIDVTVLPVLGLDERAVTQKRSK